MTMSPERFHDLLDQGTADAPPAPPVFTDLQAGRTRLRQRRTSLASAVAATVVVVAGAVGVGAHFGGDDHALEPLAPTVPSGPSKGEVDRIVAACQEKMPENRLRGPAHVMATTASAFAVEAVFASEQARYWASCSTSLLLDGATAEVVAYDAQTPGDRGLSVRIGPACADQDGCRLFGVAFSDRRDPVVAAVRVELTDGSSATLEAPDGFFAVSAVGVLPEEASFDDNGLVVGVSGLSLMHQVTFLDASGAPIAADVYDGTGSGKLGHGVAGLPTLDRYPSMKGVL